MSFSPIMSVKYDNIEYWLHHQLSPHAHIYVKAVVYSRAASKIG